MTARHTPTVKVGTRTLSGAAADDLVAIDGIEIVWGRAGLYDANDPAAIRLEVIDRDGSFATDPSVFQAPIVVTTDVGNAFRGFVDKIETRPFWTTDPATGERQSAWRVTLTGADAGIGTLARTTTPGVPDADISFYPTLVQSWGRNYWKRGTSNGSARTNDIRTRMAPYTDVTIVKPTIQAWPSPAGSGGYFSMPECAPGADLYTMLCQAMQAMQFNQPAAVKYNPSTHELSAHLFTTGKTKLTVPANTVGFDPGDPLQSTIANNVSSILGEEAYGITSTTTQWKMPNGTTGSFPPTPESNPVTADVAGLPANAGRTMFDTKIRILYLEGQNTSPRFSNFAAYITPIVAALNGKFYAPPLEFDLAAFDYGATVEAVLLAGYDQEGAWTFPGAIFEALPGWGPWFQLIGATMRFNATGWIITGNFAPARTPATTEEE